MASLQFRDDAVVALIDTPVGVSISGGTLVAHDPVTGLAVVRTASSELPVVRTWTPQGLDYPRYVFVSDVSQASVSLRPIFVGHLRAVSNSAWSGDIWRITSEVTLPNGAFVFTTSGALVGMVIGQPDKPAIVPAGIVISLAERLLEQDQAPVGVLGINVQPLTPQLQTATGLKSGVVVTQVEPKGAAAGKIFATDIIEAADEYAIQTTSDWEAHATRLSAGNMITLRIWRSGRIEQVQLTALAPAAVAAASRLGLTMRVRPGVGAEVLYVEEGSVAMVAGLAVDDVLTRVGDIPAPTPEQINDAFTAATKDRALLVAVTRGGRHFVVALVKQ
jgi:S1-C subfamily serine protease